MWGRRSAWRSPALSRASRRLLPRSPSTGTSRSTGHAPESSGGGAATRASGQPSTNPTTDRPPWKRTTRAWRRVRYRLVCLWAGGWQHCSCFWKKVAGLIPQQRTHQSPSRSREFCQQPSEVWECGVTTLGALHNTAMEIDSKGLVINEGSAPTPGWGFILVHESERILADTNRCLWRWHSAVSGRNHLLHYTSSQRQCEAT